MKHRWVREVKTLPLTETAAVLRTADQGFYYIHYFKISEAMDCPALVAESYSWDRDTKLSLVEINLCDYTRKTLTEAALKNISGLFDALRKLQCRFIVRFLYDMEGKNMETEPTKRSLIETHMRQLGGIINEHKEMIYTLQGLFIGNWGEKSVEFRFEACNNGEVVKELRVSPAERRVLIAEVDHTELVEDATYDAAAVRLRMTDQNGNTLPYFFGAVNAQVIGNGLELIAESPVILRGGMGGLYVRTTGKEGKAELVLNADGCDAIRIRFGISVK